MSLRLRRVVMCPAALVLHEARVLLAQVHPGCSRANSWGPNSTPRARGSKAPAGMVTVSGVVPHDSQIGDVRCPAPLPGGWCGRQPQLPPPGALVHP